MGLAPGDVSRGSLPSVYFCPTRGRSSRGTGLSWQRYWRWALGLVGARSASHQASHLHLRAPPINQSRSFPSLQPHPLLNACRYAYVVAASQQPDGPVRHNLTLTCSWPPYSEIVEDGEAAVGAVEGS